MATITPSDDGCISSKNFHVVQVDGINVTLRHNALGSVVAVIGNNLNNVTTVCVKDCAHVTMAFMPDMKTLYCVKASIARRIDGLLEKSPCSTVHRVINTVDTHFSAKMMQKLLTSEGRDVLGNYVGIGRLVAMFVERRTAALHEIMSAPFCYDTENTGGDVENWPSSPPNIQTTSIDDTPPSKRPKLTISPLIGMSPVVTVEEPTMTLEEKGEVSDREVIERMKSTIVNSSHMLHLLANIDTELLQVILQR